MVILSISGVGATGPGGGPFGDVVGNSIDSIGVGFSDAALLVVSIIGFCCLAVTIYSIVILRLQTREEFQKQLLRDENTGEALSYEERLARADVATLSRAERRARARTIMKQKRRVTPAAQQPAAQQEQQHQEEGAGDDEGQEGQGMLLLQNERQQQDNHDDGGDAEAEDDDDHSLLLRNPQHASRKERQRLAKLVEKEERRVHVQERRKQQEQAQHVAQREKKERERLHTMRIEEERKLQKQQYDAQEQQRQAEWNTFLSSPKRTLSVQEWINGMELLKNEKENHRTVNIDQLAASFDLSSRQVKDRIHELIQQRRVAGVFIKSAAAAATDPSTAAAAAAESAESELFVYFSDQDLRDLAKEIEKRGSITPAEMADLCNAMCVFSQG
jgi:hypothetical protein